MNVEQAKKHGPVIKWFCDNSDKGVWCRNSNGRWVLAHEPKFDVKFEYAQNDQYSELRKAMKDGKKLQRKYDNECWVDTPEDFDIESEYTSNLRIKQSSSTEKPIMSDNEIIGEVNRWLRNGKPAFWKKCKTGRWEKVYVATWEDDCVFITDDEHAQLRKRAFDNPEMKFQSEILSGRWEDCDNPKWFSGINYREKKCDNKHKSDPESEFIMHLERTLKIMESDILDAEEDFIRVDISRHLKSILSKCKELKIV